MNPGDTVIFIGPEYRFGAKSSTIGERDTVIDLGGTIHPVNEEPDQLVLVKFPLDKKAAYICSRRLKVAE